MVGAGTLSVKMSIPIIMGANIGTSVTNTLVSMSYSGNRIDLQRAFSGATVHDMFNMLTVVTLLPIEVIIGAAQGEGGPLYWISHSITEKLMGGEEGDKLFTSPIKAITSPIANEVLKSNKYVIYANTLPKPVQKTPEAVNTANCADSGLDGIRRLEGEDATSGRALLSRRLADDVDCSSYWCVDKGLDKNFKKISKSSYKKLVSCDDYILDENPCSDDWKCYMDGGAYYESKVVNGKLAKGGFLSDLSDTWAGLLGLIFSLILLCLGLIALVSLLKMVFMSKAKSVLRYATKLNDYVAILIGTGITILFQSSSVTTSALTPLCGVGALTLEKMLPLTLGANIGTTVTALLASLVSLKFNAVQIALCHLLFNIIGILVWFPVPAMRKLPIIAARTLGLYASYYVWVPPVYIFGAFVCVPGICLLISAVYGASVAGGVILTLAALAGLAVFEYAWIIGLPQREPLCYKVLSKEKREEGLQELARVQAALTGEAMPAGNDPVKLAESPSTTPNRSPASTEDGPTGVMGI